VDRIKSICIEEELCQSHDGSLEQILKQMLSYKKLYNIRDMLSDSVCKRYDEAQTYRDGKWVMFEPTDTSEFDDYMKLLAIKRKPNRK